MQACDACIKQFDKRLDPTLIKDISAWKGRYGKRGALTDTLKKYLSDAYPESLTTVELSWQVQLEFRIDFCTRREQEHWQKNSLAHSLKSLVRQGLVERLHDTSKPTGEVGRWRLKSETVLSLDHLRQQAEAQGVSIQLCDACHE